MNIKELKREVNMVISSLKNAMEDDFENYYLSDLQNAINDLVNIQRTYKEKKE